MELTEKVLDKLEDELWGKLKETHMTTRKEICDKNTSVMSVQHSLDHYRHLININLLQQLKEILAGDKGAIDYYGLREFETEEDDVIVPLLNYDKVRPLPDEEALIVLKSKDGKEHYIRLATFMIIFKELFKKDILNLTSVINSKTNCNTITIECREDE